MAQRIHSSAWTKLALAAVVVGSAGWLGGGSCTVSYCSEDCDPCLHQCVCHTECPRTHATFAATHALEHFDLAEHTGERGALQRTFSEIIGLSVERAGGPAWPGNDDTIAFARGVLSVNPAHLACREAQLDFELDSVARYDTAIVVQMHQRCVSGPENQVSFLFDPRGNVIEIDQMLSEAGDR